MPILDKDHSRPRHSRSFEDLVSLDSKDKTHEILEASLQG